MVGIVLHIQPDKCLGNPIHDRQRKAGIASDPQILQVKEEANVGHSTEQVTRRSELASSTHNLEDFLLDFTLEGSIKLVPATHA